MAHRNDIINGLAAVGMADHFDSVEIVESFHGKNVLTVVEYTLKDGLTPLIINMAKAAISQVAADNGIPNTSTHF